MGNEENRHFAPGSFISMKFLPELEQLRLAQEGAAERSRLRSLAAQQDALHVLADLSCPEDIKEFGRRHNIPAFAEVVWCQAFERGYAAGLARLREREHVGE